MNETNAHPNRGWRKSWRVPPNDVRKGIEAGTFRLSDELVSYMVMRKWEASDLAVALAITTETVLKWIDEKSSPPPYIMLALSALD